MERHMSLKDVQEINDGWIEELKNDGYYEFYTNEPFSEEYWYEKYKIVFCNINVYGYIQPDDYYSLSWKIFEQWFNNPTIMRTSIFVNCLYNKLRGLSLTKDDLKKVSHAKDELKETAKKITYMNLQKEVGRRFIDREGRNEILRFYFKDKHNSRNQKDLIDALEPDIFIISGNLGLEIMNALYDGKINIPKQGMTFFRKTLFVHLFHPSTSYFNYDYIIRKVEEIDKKIKSHK
jgi:hypothetical protein